jgi:hypothetical protein
MRTHLDPCMLQLNSAVELSCKIIGDGYTAEDTNASNGASSGGSIRRLELPLGGVPLKNVVTHTGGLVGGRAHCAHEPVQQHTFTTRIGHVTSAHLGLYTCASYAHVRPTAIDYAALAVRAPPVLMLQSVPYLTTKGVARDRTNCTHIVQLCHKYSSSWACIQRPT